MQSHIGSLSLLAKHRLDIWNEQLAAKRDSEGSLPAAGAPNVVAGPPAPAFDIHDDEALHTFWHSSSHILGHAMEEKYGDDCLLSDGPALKPHSGGASSGGFFYDALLIRNGRKWIEQSLNEAEKTDLTSPEAIADLAERGIARLLSGAAPHELYSVSELDLPGLTTVMNRLADTKAPFERLELDRATAARMFAFNPLKLAFLARIPAGEAVTVFRSGDFVDLCRGPHIRSTGQVRAVKLTATAGAQWSPNQPGGPSANPLSRVYGIAFPNPKLLKEWTTLIEEAAKRDHRVIGRQQGLFTINALSPGSPFILPHGARIVQRLLDMLRAEYRKFGYEEVITPLVFGKELWVTSGHWENYREDMFLVTTADGETAKAQSHEHGHCHEHLHDARGLKPMNCPGHCLIFAGESRSYRELPLRIAEFSPLHRNEATGALTGLTRVRKFHQDDAHIFCAPEQVFGEISQNLELIDRVYSAFGFPGYELALSTRPEKYIGEIADWDRAEADLRKALEATGKPWTLNAGDGAFYGPKIDVRVRDALGRRHQTATIQLDFQLPQRFGLKYVADSGEEKTPVIIHRAVLGSVERMLAILIEHTAGRWPFWLSPRQAMVIPVGPVSLEYAAEIQKALDGRGAGYFVDLDKSDRTLNKMIREAQVAQYNFMLVVGPKEVEARTISVRTRDGKNLGTMDLTAVQAMFREHTVSFK